MLLVLNQQNPNYIWKKCNEYIKQANKKEEKKHYNFKLFISANKNLVVRQVFSKETNLEEEQQEAIEQPHCPLVLEAELGLCDIYH